MTETSNQAESTTKTTETPVVHKNGATKNGKPLITVANTGGSFSIEEFARATGTSFTDVDDGPDEDETQEPEITGDTTSSSNDSEKEPLVNKEGETKGVEDGEEAPVEEPEAEEGAKASSRAIKAKTKDGKEFSIPEDAVVTWKVDGELKEIPLKEHLNVVAGELTVNQRLGKIASFKEELDKERQRTVTIRNKDHEERTQMLQFIKEGKPEQAMCYAAELSGHSPIELYRHFLNNIVKAYEQFEGKSPEAIDNWFLQEEAKWYKAKEKKQAESTKKAQGKELFVQKTVKALEDEGLTADEFNKAVAELSKNENFKAMNPERALDEAIEFALYRRHSDMVLTALEKVDQKLLTNKDLINLLLEQTNPHDYTVEDLVAVTKEVLGQETKRIATNLSKKVQANGLANSQKKNGARQDRRTFKAVSDMAKQFGF